MLEAFSAVLWVSVLCGLCYYVCAIVLTRIVGHSEDDDPDHDFRALHFGTISKTMLSLFELMSNPDVTRFKQLTDNSPGLLAFCISFVIFGFAVMALLTGVITEAMFEKSRIRLDERTFDRSRAKSRWVEAARPTLAQDLA